MRFSAIQNSVFYKKTGLILLTVFFLQTIASVNPLWGQSSAREWLRQGVQQCENAEFDAAIKSLEQALAKGLSEKEDVIQAYKYIAFAAAALGEDAKAENAYVELLKRYPVFDLMISDSPRLRKPFNSAREKVDVWRQMPPKIDFAPPRTATLATPVELSAEVTAIAGIDSVTFFFRQTTAATYLKQTMINTSGDTYVVTLPASAEPVSWLFYVSARSKNGKNAEWRSAGNPQVLSILKVAKKSKLWLYATIGAVGAVGLVAALAGGGGEPKPVTNNKLPDPPGTP
jgi:hypothetical protein